MDIGDLRQRMSLIPWRQLQRQPFRADVPDGFIAVLTTTNEEQGALCLRLEAMLLPQQMATEVTFYAIPFFVELIRGRLLPDRLYDLLETIAICSQPGFNPEEIEVAGQRILITAACRSRIAEGVDWYVRDVEDSGISRDARLAAAGILGCLPDLRDRWEPPFRRMLHENLDPELRDAFETWL